MPVVNTTSCPQLDLPGVKTLPGFFSVTATLWLFYPSLQHYSGSVVNGTLEDQTVHDPIRLPVVAIEAQDTVRNTTMKGLWTAGFSDPCIIDNVVYTNTSSNISHVPGGLIAENQVTGPLECFHGFNFRCYQAVGVATDSALSHVITAANFEEEVCFQTQNYTSSMVCDNAWWIGDLSNGGNASTVSINAVMDRGFKSLTNQLRTIGTECNGTRSKASGTVMVTEICTQFRWPWLLSPSWRC